MRSTPAILAFCLPLIELFGQGALTGEIDYPQLGISFTVPAGWVANEGDGVVFIGSETISGLILISIHDLTNEEEMHASLEQGFSEDGIEMFSSGTAQPIRKGIASMEYTGQIENEPAKGFGIGLLNPHGNGVTIVALALEKVYSTELKNAALALMESMDLKPVEHTGPTPAHWKKHLTNSRLTRIESHSSPSATEGGAGGGYSSEKRIDLCDGWFRYTGSSQVGVGSGTVSGHTSGNRQGQGQWDVIQGPNGKPVLRLDHIDNTRSEFYLDEQEGKVYLNGERWFRTIGGDYAADCDR